MSPPAIRAVKDLAEDADFAFIDAPPGTSCPAVEAIRGCDLVLLVTEPTPFGLHDLKLAIEMVRALQLPVGVVVNRAGIAGDEVYRYCTSHRVSIVGEISDDRKVAEAYSRGRMIAEEVPAFARRIHSLLQRIERGGIR